MTAMLRIVCRVVERRTKEGESLEQVLDCLLYTSKMNLLIDNAPDRVNGIPVYTDYRNMVQFELLMRDPDIDNLQKVQLAIDLLYKEPVSSFESAWDGLLWLYRGGVDEQRSSAASSAEKRVYDYEQDAGLILSLIHIFSLCALEKQGQRKR